MREIASGLVVFVLLCASAGVGILIRPRLPEHHRTRETVELTQITIGLLVTFAAVVLGLLTASVKHGYDSAAQDRQHYALQLTMLDQCLRDYGPDSAYETTGRMRPRSASTSKATPPRSSPAPGRTSHRPQACSTRMSPVCRVSAKHPSWPRLSIVSP